jgi:hypothetical protein
MAAQRDSSQPIRFHYGLAHKELADQLPPDDSETSLEAVMDRCLSQIDQVTSIRFELNFVLKDIKILIG